MSTREDGAESVCVLGEVSQAVSPPMTFQGAGANERSGAAAGQGALRVPGSFLGEDELSRLKNAWRRPEERRA